jgi:holo-[acyl-carrier protein] synthase
MIIGVGIDIIEVGRVEDKVNRGNGFREQVFSPAEIAFCKAQANGGQHFAARFAAKEAFLKATGKGLTLGYELHEIEVVHDDHGKPGIVLHGNFATLAHVNDWNKIHLSLSHLPATACAVVIIES